MDFDQIQSRHIEEEYETADLAIEYEDEIGRQPETRCQQAPRPVSLHGLGFRYVFR